MSEMSEIEKQQQKKIQHSTFIEAGALTVVYVDPLEGLSAAEKHARLHSVDDAKIQEVQEKEQEQQVVEKEKQQQQQTTSRVGYVEKPITISLFEACLEVFRMVYPIALTMVASFGVNRTVTMMIIGNYLPLRDTNIYGVAVTLYAVVGTSIPIGTICAVDTLVSQSHGRDPKGSSAGRYMQTAIILIWLLLIPFALLFWFSEPILVLIFEPDFAASVSQFLRLCIPFQFFQSTNLTLGRSLQAQKRPEIPLVAALVGSAVFIPLAFFVIPAYGVMASPLCLAAPMLLQCIVVFIHCVYIDGDTIFNNVSWNILDYKYWLDVASLKRLKEFMEVGAPSALAIVSEWICNEIVLLLGTTFAEHHLAALNIAWISIYLFFNITLSCSVATSAFAGNALGRNEPKRAKFYSLVCQLVNIFLLLGMSLFLTACWRFWFGLFTKSQEALIEISNSLSAIVIFMNLQGQHIGISGIFRGMGQQLFCAKVVAVALWIIGLPCSYFVGVKGIAEFIRINRGISGLLYGFSVGFFVEIVILIVKFNHLPWKELAEEASKEQEEEEFERMKSHELDEEEEEKVEF